jgi:hypothetical protein
MNFTRADLKPQGKAAPSSAEVHLFRPKQSGHSRLSPYFSAPLELKQPTVVSFDTMLIDTFLFLLRIWYQMIQIV